MNIGEFADRARAIRLSKITRYDDRFEKLRRELKSEEEATPKPANVQHRTKLGRSILRLP
jgi:hypothetical protein